jgi:hypothetical protein
VSAERFARLFSKWSAYFLRALFDSFFERMLQSLHRAEVAQLVEQPIRNRQVPGSSPGLGSIHPHAHAEIRR